MTINLLAFCQVLLIGLKLFGVINCSWWVVLLPILAIPAWFILHFIIVFGIFAAVDFLLGRFFK